ncbi:MAG: glycosyltransferase family 39 protein [Oscillospiraceae bacterium]|nr:glycosyltransferase family 39 protein [Oscillospiraceae bacterium]
MLSKTGRFGARVCTVVALLICAVILLQNRPYSLAVPLAVAAGAAVLWLAFRFVKPGRGTEIGLFLVRFALALGFILWLESQPVQDFDTMYRAAVQLARGGHGYLQDTYFFNWAYQSAFVAYEALVIRLFGESLLPLQLLNALWMSGTAVLVYRIAGRVAGGKAAAAVGTLYTLYPAPLFLAGVLTNQHLSVFLLYAGLYVLMSGRGLSWPRTVGAGVLIALGNAMRPIGIIPLLACVIWLVLRAMTGRSWKTLLHGAAAAASYFLCGILLSALIVGSGINPNGLANNQPMWKFVVGLNQETDGRWNRADYERFIVPSADDPEGVDAAMREEVAQRLSVGPGKLAGLAMRKSSAMWAGYEDLYWGFGHLDPEKDALPRISWNSLQLLLAHVEKGLYLLAFALAFAGVLCRLTRKEKVGADLVPVLLLCGYYAVHLIVEVQVRYRYFLMPCVFILAAMALTDWWKKE